MRRDGDWTLKLARSVADGKSVDWDAEETGAPDEESRQVVHGFRLLSKITGFHEDLISEIEPLSAGDKWGALEILEALASGSYGEIYRARDPRLDREVALKLIAGETTEDDGTIGEARALAKVDHPNVVTVHGADVHAGRAGIWMELIRGRTLDSIVKSDGPLGAGEAALTGIDVCRALAAVHASGLVHRDVKARNVMREKGGRIVLMDFGLGREKQAAGGGRTVSGTPLYMAPEILAGEEATVQSDLYGAGILLYLLASGAFPVTGRSAGEIQNAHESGRSTSLRDARPGLPESFLRVVERATANKPGERFATAGEMEKALADFLDRESAESSGSPAIASPRPGGGPRLWFACAIAGIAIAAGVFFLRSGSPAYSVEASLYREGPSGAERLRSGSAVSPGDELFLKIQASSDLYTYVLSEDENGASFVLFPLPGYELKNPLPGDQSHQLPGNRDGEEIHWQVTSAGGREHFFVVACPSPVEEIERAIAGLPRAELGRPVRSAPISGESFRRLRGIGGAVPAFQSTGSNSPAPGSVGDIAGRLELRSEEVRGVWMREIVLENPQ